MTAKEEDNTLRKLQIDKTKNIRYISLKVKLGKFYDGLKLLDENQEEIIAIDPVTFDKPQSWTDKGFRGAPGDTFWTKAENEKEGIWTTREIPADHYIVGIQCNTKVDWPIVNLSFVLGTIKDG